MDALRKLKNLFWSAILPSFCCNCHSYIKPDDSGLCDDCFESIAINGHLFCAVCKARLPIGEGLPAGRQVCHRGTRYLLAAATNYDQPAVKNLIWHIKYRGQKNAATRAAEIISSYMNGLGLTSVVGEKTVVVPIPLHYERQKERGFNQSREIAERLVVSWSNPLLAMQRQRNWPIVAALSKRINTKPQAEIEEHQARQKNIADAFVFNQRCQKEIAGADVILIDDVHTSGATISEAAKVLKQAGARKIIALVLAKA